MTAARPVTASVVIPAHDEEAGIGRLLTALLADEARALEVLVVCNGCTDGTASVARGFGSQVRVIELERPSKREALLAGDRAAVAFPRVFLDADVVLSAAGLAALVAPVADGRALAAGPQRSIPRQGTSTVVRWYYDVWERLPHVQRSLYGRGVIALSEAGARRVRELPAVMADDLAMSEAFADDERMVVDGAVVTVYPPKRTRDLVRRRVRAATGNAQAAAAGLTQERSRTGLGDLVGLVRSSPRLAPKVVVFLGVTLVSRVRARRAIRRGDFDTWLRDESSRA